MSEKNIPEGHKPYGEPKKGDDDASEVIGKAPLPLQHEDALDKINRELMEATKGKPTIRLAPPDLTQCQGYLLEGTMLPGGVRKFVRCEEKPAFIATTGTAIWPDLGVPAVMSICAGCLSVLKNRLGKELLENLQTVDIPAHKLFDGEDSESNS